MKPRRELFLPGPEAPHWLPAGSAPGGLLYLAWGHRQYGEQPIPPRLHHGWTYMAILSGRPLLIVGSREEVIEKGGLIVAGPDVPYGWSDQLNASCKLLVWVWSRPPTFEIPVHGHSCWLRKCSPAAMNEIEKLHLRTRREIQHTDACSPRILHALQSFIDVAFERAAGSAGNQKSRDAQRLHLAEAWMRRHLDIRSPAKALAEYLGVSTMTLHRLFREAAEVSTGQAFLDLKMNEAAKLLKNPSASVKEIGHSLGYRYAGDFTRAFKKRFGIAPAKIIRKVEPERVMPDPERKAAQGEPERKVAQAGLHHRQSKRLPS